MPLLLVSGGVAVVTGVSEVEDRNLDRLVAAVEKLPVDIDADLWSSGSEAFKAGGRLFLYGDQAEPTLVEVVLEVG